jgi:GH15 family glucan-1,4-alpha-glucosidase
VAYQAIENYGVIGDMHTVALVGLDGSIDWCCLPRFDAPSVFAGLLDDKNGGRFSLMLLADQVTRKQFYWPETNVLVTRFLSEDGVGEVTDYMPVKKRGSERHTCQIVRTVKAVRGTVTFGLSCQPAFNYARDEHEVKVNDKGACFRSSTLSLGLAAEVPLEQQGDGVVAEFTLE